MKKILLMIMISFAIIMTTFAQQNTNSSNPETNTQASKIPAKMQSNFTFQTVPIYKIYLTKDTYYVLYQKNDWSIGKVAFPKEWFKSGDARGNLRNMPEKFGAFLTIYYQDGIFYNATISAPNNQRASVWGVGATFDVNPYIADDSFTLQF